MEVGALVSMETGHPVDSSSREGARISKGPGLEPHCCVLSSLVHPVTLPAPPSAPTDTSAPSGGECRPFQPWPESRQPTSPSPWTGAALPQSWGRRSAPRDEEACRDPKVASGLSGQLLRRREPLVAFYHHRKVLIIK